MSATAATKPRINVGTFLRGSSAPRNATYPLSPMGSDSRTAAVSALVGGWNRSVSTPCATGVTVAVSPVDRALPPAVDGLCSVARLGTQQAFACRRHTRLQDT